MKSLCWGGLAVLMGTLAACHSFGEDTRVVSDCGRSQQTVLSGNDTTRFRAMFGHEDSLARQMAIQEFENAVAESDRVDALVELWDGVLDSSDRHCVHDGILAYIVQGDYPKRYNHPDLNKRIHTARSSIAPGIRRTLLNIYRLRDDESSRQKVQEFLKDDDEGVRKLALTSVVRYKNAREILDDYVKTCRDSDSHAKSIERAEFYLRRMNEKKPLGQSQDD